MLLQVGNTLTQAEHPGLQLSLGHEPVGVTLAHPRHTWPPLAELLRKRGQGRAWSAGRGWQPAPICLSQALGVGQERPDFLPDSAIHQSRPHLGMLTDAFPPEAVRIGAQAAVVGRGARCALAGAGALAFPVAGIATLAARE